ncbi:MAG: hypothetical protein IMW89_21140 [Ktedonobacteraceae bacterium]|nr:hypothetical protein [Ktedonobacteraceae bacterium]
MQEIPSITLGRGSLKALESIIKGYLRNLRKAAARPEIHRKRLKKGALTVSDQMRILEALHQQFTSLLLRNEQELENVAVLLTVEEIRAITLALSGFLRGVKERAPATLEREAILREVAALRQQLVSMLAHYGT